MSVANGHHPHDPEYWMAYLASSIAHALAVEPCEATRKMLRKSLGAFMRSKCCSTHLAEHIRSPLPKGR